MHKTVLGPSAPTPASEVATTKDTLKARVQEVLPRLLKVRADIRLAIREHEGLVANLATVAAQLEQDRTPRKKTVAAYVDASTEALASATALSALHAERAFLESAFCKLVWEGTQYLWPG